MEQAKHRLQMELSTLKKLHERVSASLSTRDSEHSVQITAVTSSHAKLEAELSLRKQEIKALNDQLTQTISVSTAFSLVLSVYQ